MPKPVYRTPAAAPDASDSFLKRAIADANIEFTGEGKNERIHYTHADHSERWSDPEEKVRAEFYAELLYRYEYPPERIAFEVTVPRRTPADKADIVVYEDDEGKKPFLIIECKKEGISDAEFLQSIEQACGNRASLAAPYCGAVAGGTRRFLDFRKAKPQERAANIIADLPTRYGKPPEWRFHKGGWRMSRGKREPMPDIGGVPREALRAAIRKCHQTLWEGGKRSPIVAFGEFCKIIFIKIRDEKQCPPGQPYVFQRRTEDTDKEVAARIHAMYAAVQKLEPDVFTDKINVDDSMLARVVEHLEAINLNKTDLDTKGVAFEEFLGSFFKGDAGQYFTPRELICFCVQMMKPRRDQFVLDTSCGSGGFLLYTLDYVRAEAERLYPDWQTDPEQRQECRDYWHPFAEKRLFGVEINDELARVSKMNMIIHDDGHTNIVGSDGLDFLSAMKARNKQLVPGKFDLVLTNPPFGSIVKRTEKGEGYLEQFKLLGYIGKNTDAEEAQAEAAGEGDAKRGAKSVKARSSVKTEILFLERIHTFLKAGGRAAVVLPDGILTNSSLQGVRNWLLEHFRLLAVVSMPQFAFSHYDAGVKASIVFLEKLDVGEEVPDDTPIFMALAENIGYDATGRKTFAVTVVEEGETEVGAAPRIERHRCDFFDYRVTYEWSTANPKKPAWSERHREVIPHTDLVAQWEAFQKNPKPFFV